MEEKSWLKNYWLIEYIVRFISDIISRDSKNQKNNISKLLFLANVIIIQ